MAGELSEDYTLLLHRGLAAACTQGKRTFKYSADRGAHTANTGPFLAMRTPSASAMTSGFVECEAGAYRSQRQPYRDVSSDVGPSTNN